MPTKSANNAVELSYINFIPANNTLNFTATPISGGAPIVDATAGVHMSKDKASVYTGEDIVLVRDKVNVVEDAIFKTAERDGRNVVISLPLDPGATGGAYCKDLARRLADRGFVVKFQQQHKQ